MNNVTQLTIAIPDWVGVFLSLGTVGFLIYLGNLHCSLGQIIKEFPKMSRALDLISYKLKEKRFFDEHIYASAASPIKLTPAGEDLLRDSGAHDFVNKYTKELVDRIKSKSPKTAYDVQIIARDVVENLRDEDRFSQFKDYVYKKGMPLEPIFIVMSIYLRDVTLPILGFTKADIDKHDPNKIK